MRVIIIGGGAAGASCATRLIQGNRTFDIRKFNKKLDKQAITACFLV